MDKKTSNVRTMRACYIEYADTVGYIGICMYVHTYTLKPAPTVTVQYGIGTLNTHNRCIEPHLCKLVFGFGEH